MRGEPQADVAAALWAPIEKGLVVASVKSARNGGTAALPVELLFAATPSYQFAHDRIQQAAYDCLEERERQTLHLKTGRELLRAVGELGGDMPVSAWSTSSTAPPRCSPTKSASGSRASTCAPRARSSRSPRTPPGSATSRRGSRSCLRGAWESQHALWFDLQRGASDVASWVGEYELCERRVTEGLAHAATLLEKAAFNVIAVRAGTMRPHTMPEAVNNGLEGLSLLGMDLPRAHLADTARVEVERARTLLARGLARPARPASQEEIALDEARLAMVLAAATPAWYVDPDVLKSSSRPGCSSMSDWATTRRPPSSMRPTRSSSSWRTDTKKRVSWPRARALLERFPSHAEEARTLLILGGHVEPLAGIPLTENIPLFRRGHRLAVEAGDLVYAGTASPTWCWRSRA